jgi:regulator of replication initiation timing
MVIGKTKKRIEKLEEAILSLTKCLKGVDTELQQTKEENKALKAEVEDLKFIINNSSDKAKPLTQQELMREWQTGEETRRGDK